MLCPNTTWPVLYVDDNADEHLLLHDTVTQLQVPLRLQSVAQPGSAREYLQHTGRFTDPFRYPSPALMLLDYGLDSGNSLDLLRWMRLQPQCANLPVVMYSGSDFPACIALSYHCGADHFIVKPLGIGRIEAFLRTLCDCLAGEPPCFELLRNLPEYRASSVVIPRQAVVA